MRTVELYAAVRRAVFVQGISQREAARRFGLSRTTVAKMVQFSLPPGYRRREPARRPKLEPFVGVIDQILDQDTHSSKKQRHSAWRLFERLRQEYGYEGGYTVVKDYVREKRRSSQEMFVPLSHPPGHAQADFGEAEVIVAGVQQTAHFFVMDLPHSDDAFVMAFPSETSEAFCEGHNQAFGYFGGVPARIVYDNSKIAVARILGNGTRKRTQVFTELQSHYLFEERFARPAKGNDKGKVEGLVGYARRNFFVPLPRVQSFEELNLRLQEQCHKRRARRLRGQQQSIGERFERDRLAFLALPATPYDSCDKVSSRATSLSLVRYRSNDYSVPTAYGHRQVLVKGYVDEVVICCGMESIARHPRCYEREQTIYDPLHYLALLEHKTNALEQAAPLQKWELPAEFAQIRHLLEVRQAKRGTREYIQVLRLLECFPFETVAWAIKEALRLQAISFDAVKHLVLCRIERRPARLDLTLYPHLPAAEVSLTLASEYLSLLDTSLLGSVSPVSQQVCQGVNNGNDCIDNSA
jgi:transposase